MGFVTVKGIINHKLNHVGYVGHRRW